MPPSEIFFAQREWNPLKFAARLWLSTEWLHDIFLKRGEQVKSTKLDLVTRQHRLGVLLYQRRPKDYVSCCCCTFGIHLWIPTCHSTWGLLMYRKVCTRRIPKTAFWSAQATARRVSATQFLQRYDEDPSILECTVIGDDRWVHYCEPKSKRQSMQRKH